MDVTYYVALPFVIADDGVACLSANAAVMRAEAPSCKPGCAGAIAFCRTGDPATGEFGYAKLIRKFGDVPRTERAVKPDYHGAAGQAGMYADRRVQIGVRRSHDGGGGPAGRQASDVDALRIDRIVPHDLTGDAGE